MKRLLVLVLLFWAGRDASAQISDTSLWVPNGPVKAVLLHDSLLYVGGTFSQVSPMVGHFVALDSSTANVSPPFPAVNGRINCMAKDSIGRIYVGGNFNQVGIYTCSNLFRLTPQGLFDPTFDLNPDGEIFTLYVYGNNLFIGGEFQYVDGNARMRGASVRVTSSSYVFSTTINDTITAYAPMIPDTLLGFDPHANGPIYAYCADRTNNALLVGGNFMSIGGGAIAYMGKLDIQTAVYLPFGNVPWTPNPQVNAPIRSIRVIGTRVFIAGDFTAFVTQQRKGLAILSLTSGYLQTDNAGINGTVRDIEVVLNKIYIGGNFSIVSGNYRNNLACLDSNFVLQPWNPSASGQVYDIACWDSTAFCVAGNFKMLGTDTCYYAGIVDTSGAVHVFNASLDGVAYAAIPATTNGKFWVGGNFVGANGVLRENFCAININTKRPNNWRPNFNNTVTTLYADSTQLFVAGDFSSINFQTRGRLASFDLSTNALTTFNPSINGYVRTMTEDAAGLYIGGNFTTVGTIARNNIACVNVTTSQATVWNPNCTGTVNKIILDGNDVYVGGFFSLIGGYSRENLARISASTALADFSWICDTDDGIYDMDLYNGQLYIGGWFLNVEGQPRSYFASLNAASGNLSPFNPGLDDYIRTFVRWNDDYFISGPFITVGGTLSRTKLCNYDIGDGQFDTWTPYPNVFPETMQVSQNWLYIGGTFTNAGYRYHPHLAMISINFVTGIPQDNFQARPAIKVWPNPANDFVFVSNPFQANSGKTTVEILDLNGKLVSTQTENSTDGTFKIDFSNFESGMYFVKVIGENGNFACEKISVVK